ncbi:MAG: hypothetical protein J0H68_06850 [Sphingobacteriia bacterium]|nr:hypothetical protein [Sphingobacteriia bacterium]
MAKFKGYKKMKSFFVMLFFIKLCFANEIDNITNVSLPSNSDVNNDLKIDIDELFSENAPKKESSLATPAPKTETAVVKSKEETLISPSINLPKPSETPNNISAPTIKKEPKPIIMPPTNNTIDKELSLPSSEIKDSKLPLIKESEKVVPKNDKAIEPILELPKIKTDSQTSSTPIIKDKEKKEELPIINNILKENNSIEDSKISLPIIDLSTNKEGPVIKEKVEVKETPVISTTPQIIQPQQNNVAEDKKIKNKDLQFEGLLQPSGQKPKPTQNIPNNASTTTSTTIPSVTKDSKTSVENKNDGAKYLVIVTPDKLWENSIMFNNGEINQLQNALNDFLYGYTPTAISSKDGKDAPKIKRSKHNIKLSLKTILYFSQTNWTVWINNFKINYKDKDKPLAGGFKIVSVSPNSVTLNVRIDENTELPINRDDYKDIPGEEVEYSHNDNYIVIRLYLNQVFNSKTLKITDGEY